MAEGLGRPSLSGDPFEDAGNALARLRHVDMRIGPIGVEQVGAFDHRGCYVCVQIERAHDRHVRPHGGPDAADQLSLPVLEVLRHHRAVQVEIDGVEASRPGQFFEQHGGDTLISLLGHVGRGAGVAPDEGHDLMARARGRAGEAVAGDVAAGECRQDRRPPRQAWPARGTGEMFVGRFAGREGVGFVMKSGEGNAHGRYPNREAFAVCRLCEATVWA